MPMLSLSCSSSSSNGCLVLGVHAGQLLAYPVVDLHELAHAAIDADGLSLAQVSLVVLGRNALLVARLGQPLQERERERVGSRVRYTYVPVVEVGHHLYFHVGYGLLAKLTAGIHLSLPVASSSPS